MELIKQFYLGGVLCIRLEYDGKNPHVTFLPEFNASNYTGEKIYKLTAEVDDYLYKYYRNIPVVYSTAKEEW